MLLMAKHTQLRPLRMPPDLDADLMAKHTQLRPLRMPPDLDAEFRAAAKRRGISMSEFVRRLIRAELDRDSATA